jgi:predicted TPR repeat methyltransferase
LQALDLYGSIEEYLDFKEEVQSLYSKTLDLVLNYKCTNLIDIGCGQGDFCLLAQEQGIKTFGVDLSSKQIELAKQKPIDVQCCDIKEVKGKFECATAVFDVLNYIPKRELEQFLKSTYTLLEDNGYFIFDINTLFGFEEIAQGTLTIDLKQKFIAIDANFESNTLFTDITTFSSSNGLYNKQSGTIEQFYHDETTFLKLFQKIGFELIEVQNVYLHNEEEADKQIYVIQKKGIK